MNFIRKISAAVMAAVMMTVFLPACVYSEKAAGAAVQVSSQEGITVSDSSVTVEKGSSVQVTVSAGGAKTKISKSSKNVYYTCGKTKNGKFTLTLKGNKEGSCTITVQDKNNRNNSAKIKVSVVKEKSYSFRTKELYDSHYKKHGSEFGDITQEEYLKKANELINDQSDSILKKRSDDNDLMYFNKDTNEFLVLSEDGYIRTYFIPNSGIKYWERQ